MARIKNNAINRAKSHRILFFTLITFRVLRYLLILHTFLLQTTAACDESLRSLYDTNRAHVWVEKMVPRCGRWKKNRVRQTRVNPVWHELSWNHITTNVFL